MLRQSQFDSVLTPIIYHHINLGINNVPSLRPRIFNVQTSTLATEKGTGMGGMSVDAWDAYKDSGKKGRMDFDQLYTQDYTHVEYPVEIVVEKRLLINDQYRQIGNYLQRVGISAAQKMDVDAASLFNNAFSTNHTWSDGKPLCADDHPVSPNESGTTYTNEGTSALTRASVSSTRVEMMRFKDDRGNEIGVMPNELIVPPELEDTAYEIVSSVLVPDSANNAANAQQGRYSVIVNPRLSDTNAWFMSDGVWRQQVVNWYERETMDIMLVRETTTEVVYEVKLHYSYGVDDWRWVYGHNPS